MSSLRQFVCASPSLVEQRACEQQLPATALPHVQHTAACCLFHSRTHVVDVHKRKQVERTYINCSGSLMTSQAAWQTDFTTDGVLNEFKTTKEAAHL